MLEIAPVTPWALLARDYHDMIRVRALHIKLRDAIEAWNIFL